jgi:hypothetical protein
MVLFMIWWIVGAVTTAGLVICGIDRIIKKICDAKIDRDTAKQQLASERAPYMLEAEQEINALLGIETVCPTCGRDRAWHFVNNMYCIVELRPGVKTMFGDWQYGKLKTQLSYNQCLKCGYKTLPGADDPKHDCVPRLLSDRQPSFSDLHCDTVTQAKEAFRAVRDGRTEQTVLVSEGCRTYAASRDEVDEISPGVYVPKKP